MSALGKNQTVEGPFYMLGRPELEGICRAFRDLEDLDDRLMETGVSRDNETPVYRLAGIVARDEGGKEIDVLVTGYHQMFVPKAYARILKRID